MLIADRATARGGLNDIAKVRAALSASGVAITNLSDSNPTRHGLLHCGVLEAVRKNVYDASRYEPHPRGPVSARESLAARYGGDPGDYWLVSSTSQAYVWLMTLLADPGQSIGVPAPGYPLIPPLARLAGVRTVEYRLHYSHSGGWVVDLASLTAAASAPDMRAIVVVNPGNPTGAYLSAGREDVVEACVGGGIAVISDEVFRPFRLDGAAATLAGEDRVPTFTLGGLSKLLCAPQLKLAWIRLSGPPAELDGIRDGLDSIADAFLPVNGPVAAALPDLLGLADESVQLTRSRLATNLATARALLADGPYRVRRCEGGWTVVVDVPHYLTSEELPLYLLKTARLAVHPGWFYDLADEGALALSLLPAPDRFEDGLGRLRVAIDRLAN